jgi:transposase
VRTRARFISLIRALLRREGLPVQSGMARSFPRRLALLTVPEELSAEIAPLLAVMEGLNQQIDAGEAGLAPHAAQDPVRRLETIPNIGPVTALSFVATLGQISRSGEGARRRGRAAPRRGRVGHHAGRGEGAAQHRDLG